jgi:hypothetical protein
VEAVSTNHEIAVLGAPVGQADRHPLCILGDPDTLRPEPEDVPVEGGQQNLLEQSLVDHHRWRVEAGHNLLGQASSEWSSSRAAEDRIGRDRARVLNGHPEVQALQHLHRVRPQQDAGADLAQLASLLENHNVKSGFAQSNRCAKPTDAGADDNDLPIPGQGSHLLKGSLTSPT